MSLLGRDLAIDLGGASTRIYARGRGIVLDEPSAVTLDDRTGKVIAYGADVTSGPTCRPVSGGLPADGELTRLMVRHFLGKVHRVPLARPRLVMALPDGSSPIERTALSDVAFEADARRIELIPHSFAAALGAGLPLGDCAGHMVIDVGRDSTRIAVLSSGAAVSTTAVPGGGEAVNRCIVRLVDREHGLVLDESEAEAAKRAAGTEWKPLNRHVTVRARDPGTGREHEVRLPVQEMYEASRQPIEAIVRAAMEAVEQCPAELAADLGERGAVLMGGGALLRGLARRLRASLGMPVRRVERPLECVALGLGRCVDDLGLVSRLRVTAGP
ncbi:rod shape-determining protein [Nonomuraea phyllanthi]|uniref:Rod shape-determining protein n=1 Tax=Nonomuraea phyllanthi TaxID=2219224 RepID=A0A5C4WGZ3_9ACTN|nr:rod shape-determining protein [Nonomuraea phyllanthi]KAB8193499.1 rod shape-determining protein [Nonomuraea phyllanthi]QFY12241.1 rod shape-determining protein [Nonomuraea phyllanthi]